MISSIASISSSSSATVRVEKATSEFLIGPDWTMNIYICDTINNNQMLAKDVVKAVKKRLQHKNPKVQLLALTLLETMVKNCGDYVHFQISEKNILQDMVKIVKKRTDMHVMDKILALIGSWHDAFGGSQGKHPQYFMAYEELRRTGLQFPQRSPEAVSIFTPPVTNPISRQPQPGYGMPSSSSTRLDEAMAADDNFSFSSLNSMCEVLDLLSDMLQAIDPSDRSAVKDELIVDLVEQCRANQKKLMDVLATTGNEELLGQGLDLNDSLQTVLGKHDAIASGSPQATNATTRASEDPQDYSSLKLAEATLSNAASSCNAANLSVPVIPAPPLMNDEEEDDFAQLARRHSKPRIGTDMASSEAPASPIMSNAVIPITSVALGPPVRSKDQDIVDLLSLTLSTTTPSTEQTPTPMDTQPPGPHPPVMFSSEAYPGNPVAFNSYVAPWAQPQPLPQPQPQSQWSNPSYTHPHPQPSRQPQPPVYSNSPHLNQTRPEFQPQPEQQQPLGEFQLPPHQQLSQFLPQYSSSSPGGYIPPPWAATPGYLTNPNPISRPPPNSSYPMMLRPVSSSMARSSQHESVVYGETSQEQKPYIPPYRLFEDLDVFGNNNTTAKRRFKATAAGNASANLSGSANHSMVWGRK